MIVFVVVTEEWYGGENKIKVFKARDSAKEYANKLSQDNDVDVIILEMAVE